MRRTLPKSGHGVLRLLPKPTNPRWVFTKPTTLPPPEWVQPLIDLSDLTNSNPNKTLHLSPWVPQILNLLHPSITTTTTTMEHNLTHFCHKFLVKLSPNFVSHILLSDRLRGLSDTAFRFFQWAAKQKGYKHNLECYVSLIDVLSASNCDLDRIKFVFRELKSKEFVMNVSCANLLIKAFGGIGMVEELLWVWRMMKENAIEPSLYTYNCLMNGLVNSMFIESAEQVFEVMESGKVGPDVVTYNTMIKGYIKSGKDEESYGEIWDMEVRGVEPDKITYLTLMQACYSEGDYDSCLGIYLEMEEKELEIPPHAYNLVIGGLCKVGKLMEG